MNIMTDVTFDPTTLELDPLLKRLHLANARKVWKQLADRCDGEGKTCREFFAILVAEEIAHRRQTRVQRSVDQAGFPFLKTVDDFDFTLQPVLRPQLLGPYLSPELVTEGRNLILMGKPGRGKTMLSVAIAYRAIQNGFTARFVTAAHLIDELSQASRRGELRKALAEYVQPAVLVIDEVGYLSHGPDAANVLFHVVNERHAKCKPMIFTTNKSPFTQWGDVLHDHDLAATIVDRTLERGRLLILEGPSYRTRHLPELDAPAQAAQEPARFSGIQRPEFPEPAWSSSARVRALALRSPSFIQNQAGSMGLNSGL
jgi:DNA replication protein DnaC